MEGEHPGKPGPAQVLQQRAHAILEGVELDEARREPSRGRTERVQDARLGGEADLPPCKPQAPAQVRLLEVREVVGIERSDVRERAAAQEKRSALGSEDHIRLPEAILALERAAVGQESGRRQERAGGVQALGIVEHEQLGLACAPGRSQDERIDKRSKRAGLGHRVVVQEQDELAARLGYSPVAGACEAGRPVVPHDLHFRAQAAERYGRAVVDDDRLELRILGNGEGAHTSPEIVASTTRRDDDRERGKPLSVSRALNTERHERRA